jgi:hypothetical protein
MVKLTALWTKRFGKTFPAQETGTIGYLFKNATCSSL